MSERASAGGLPECSEFMKSDYDDNLQTCLRAGITPVAGMCYDGDYGVGTPDAGCFTSVDDLTNATCTFGEDIDRIKSGDYISGKCAVDIHECSHSLTVSKQCDLCTKAHLLAVPCAAYRKSAIHSL